MMMFFRSIQAVCISCVLFLLCLVLSGCESRTTRHTLPEFGEAPEFTLTDADGAPFRFQDHEGKVRVVSFFFSRCPSICPRINSQLAEVFQKLSSHPDVAFVSISVDPEFDTPSVLKEYARDYRKGSEKWKFLTGEKTTIEGLLNNGFKLASGMLPDEHNTRIVIVDRSGKIRGFYQGMEPEHMRKFAADLPLFFP